MRLSGDEPEDVRRSGLAFLPALLFLCLHTGSGAAKTAAPAGTDTAEGRESAPDTEPPRNPELEQAREQQLEVVEDPQAKREAKKLEDPTKLDEALYKVKGYTSLRVHYRATEDEGVWGDGGSRGGVEGHWRFMPAHLLYGRLEAGFNLLDELDSVFNPKGQSAESQRGETFFRRLLYLGMETPRTYVSFGKNWSTYYQVAGFTDLFDASGGQAVGVYNAGTDGGAAGTGRADKVLQSRVHLNALPKRWSMEPVNLNVQVQYGRPIPGVPGKQYGTGLGLSAIVKTREHFSVGLAYNRAAVSDIDDTLRAAGIDGDDQALLLGMRWLDEHLYLASNLARLLNHESTVDGHYFDAWGWELYGHYALPHNIYVVGGANVLEPDSGQLQAGLYRVRYALLGLRYAFFKPSQRVYLEARFDDSRTADGEALGNTWTAGVRWDLP